MVRPPASGGLPGGDDAAQRPAHHPVGARAAARAAPSLHQHHRGRLRGCGWLRERRHQLEPETSVSLTATPPSQAPPLPVTWCRTGAPNVPLRCRTHGGHFRLRHFCAHRQRLRPPLIKGFPSNAQVRIILCSLVAQVRPWPWKVCDSPTFAPPQLPPEALPSATEHSAFGRDTDDTTQAGEGNTTGFNELSVSVGVGSDVSGEQLLEPTIGGLGDDDGHVGRTALRKLLHLLHHRLLVEPPARHRRTSTRHAGKRCRRGWAPHARLTQAGVPRGARVE